MRYRLDHEEVEDICEKCEGFGKVVKFKCEECKGVGCLEKVVSETVKIPVGAGNEQILRKEGNV